MIEKYQYHATLNQRSSGANPIYDADTVHLKVKKGFKWSVDFGFHIGFDISLSVNYALGACRLYGIDAPEMRGAEREKGIIARDFLRDLMAKNPEFMVKTHKDTKGKYGRYLVDIFLEDGTHVNALLVEKGYAEWKNYD